jgi:hypothetical protein
MAGARAGLLNMTARTNSVAIPHVERMLASRSGEWILISCDCPIGQDHTYAEWVARFGAPGVTAS